MGLAHLLPDLFPDDPRHLISVQLDDWVLDDDFLLCSLQQGFSRASEGYCWITRSRIGLKFENQRQERCGEGGRRHQYQDNFVSDRPKGRLSVYEKGGYSRILAIVVWKPLLRTAARIAGWCWKCLKGRVVITERGHIMKSVCIGPLKGKMCCWLGNDSDGPCAVGDKNYSIDVQNSFCNQDGVPFGLIAAIRENKVVANDGQHLLVVGFFRVCRFSPSLFIGPCQQNPVGTFGRIHFPPTVSSRHLPDHLILPSLSRQDAATPGPLRPQRP